MRAVSELVSIILPIYQTRKEEVRECLESIQRQEGCRIEVLCVVDGPDASYEEIFEKCRRDGMDLKVFREEHKGVSASRNKGMREASGKWLMFVDADDWLYPGAVQSMLACGEKHGAELVMADYDMCYRKKKTAHIYARDFCTFGPADNLFFLEDILKPQTGAGFVWGKLFCRKKLAEEEVFFNESLSAAEDEEFMLRAAYNMNKICYIPERLYAYRFNPNSAVRKYQNNYVKKYCDTMKELRKFIWSHRDILSLRESYYNCLLYHLLLITVNYSFHPGKPGSGRGKRKEFKTLLKEPVWQECMQHIDYSHFSLSRKITLFCLRTHCYFLVYLIAGIRQAQFQRFVRDVRN